MAMDSDPPYTTHTVDSRDMRIAFSFYDDESLGCDLVMTQFGAYSDGYNATTTGHLTQAQAWKRIFDLTRDGWAYRGEWRSSRFQDKLAS